MKRRGGGEEQEEEEEQGLATTGARNTSAHKHTIIIVWAAWTRGHSC